MTSSEWLPPPVPFELVRRGYAPDQVTAHIERLEYDLRIATANRDATSQRLAELTAQLTTAQAEADALRAKLDRQALEPMSLSGLSDRMQRMIRLAEDEAAETRSTADEYSADVRGRADAETAQLRQTAASETAAQRAAAEAEATRLRAAAEADAAAVRTAAHAQLTDITEARAAFDAERDRTRNALSEQVATLIGEATALAEATRASARDDADLAAARAEAEADRLVSQARAEAERLAAAQAARRAELEEDFTLAINARRAEAHGLIGQAEHESHTVAAARIRQADEHARNLVSSATDHANQLVAHAAAQSHQRIADADSAVQVLTALRGELLQQLARFGEELAQVRSLVDSAASVLTPLDAEPVRPRPDDFPADPVGRPTPAPGFDGEPPAWSPPEPPTDGDGPQRVAALLDRADRAARGEDVGGVERGRDGDGEPDGAVPDEAAADDATASAIDGAAADDAGTDYDEVGAARGPVTTAGH